MPSALSRPASWTGPSFSQRLSASIRSSISTGVWFGERSGRLERSWRPCSPSTAQRSYHLPSV